MARKSARKDSAKSTAAESKTRKRHIKLWFSDEELQQVRVAAAVQNRRSGDFARSAVLAEAERVISRYLGGSSQ
jgi:uncharacterized protein (DUF1778 family)